jgi:hypothetical protein
MQATGFASGEHLCFLVNGTFPATRSRQLLKSFHNKSFGDKDSPDPTVYDPLHAHITMGSDAPIRQADTQVSLTFSAALRNVQWRQA